MPRSLLCASHTLSMLLFCMLSACSPSDNHDPQPPPPAPSPERCEALPSEQECFAQGCDFFTSANILVIDTDDQTACQKQTTTSICLFAPDADSADELLTFYQRDRPDGTRQMLQLGRDVALEGWRRCGGLDAPPDCNCDGLPDASEM